jgi:hypothetical protein
MAWINRKDQDIKFCLKQGCVGSSFKNCVCLKQEVEESSLKKSRLKRRSICLYFRILFLEMSKQDSLGFEALSIHTRVLLSSFDENLFSNKRVFKMFLKRI